APRTDCPREVQHEALSRVFDYGIPVIAVERVVPGLDDLHVLLRHRLLREAHGFEGFVWIEIGSNLHHLAVTEVDDVGSRRFRLDAALLPPTAEATDQHGAITDVSDFRDIDVNLSEYLVEVPHHRAEALVSPVNGRFPAEGWQIG